MEQESLPEVWLRGAVDGIPPLLQPVAHAMMQSMEEIIKYTHGLEGDQPWKQPSALASVAFHLKHTDGFLDRLFTYASGQQLDVAQLQFLSREGERETMDNLDGLITKLQVRIEKCLQQLKNTPESSLTEPRYVGRKKIESTVLGLLFHAAEHMSRHTGQILVTSRIVRNM